MSAHTAAELVDLLRTRYAPGAGWAVMEQVPPAPGHNQRLLDVLVVGCWKEHGYEVIGVEVKVSRSDWLRELRDPAKAAALMPYCDRWYLLAATERIVRPGELPPGWGMLIPVEIPGAGVGGRVVHELRAVVPAPKLNPLPMNRQMFAALMRRAVETFTAEGPVRVAHERALRRVEKMTERLTSVLGSAAYHSAEVQDLRRRVRMFEEGAYAEGVALIARARAEVEEAATAAEGA